MLTSNQPNTVLSGLANVSAVVDSHQHPELLLAFAACTNAVFARTQIHASRDHLFTLISSPSFHHLNYRECICAFDHAFITATSASQIALLPIDHRIKSIIYQHYKMAPPAAWRARAFVIMSGIRTRYPAAAQYHLHQALHELTSLPQWPDLALTDDNAAKHNIVNYGFVPCIDTLKSTFAATSREFYNIMVWAGPVLPTLTNAFNHIKHAHTKHMECLTRVRHSMLGTAPGLAPQQHAQGAAASVTTHLAPAFTTITSPTSCTNADATPNRILHSLSPFGPPPLGLVMCSAEHVSDSGRGASRVSNQHGAKVEDANNARGPLPALPFAIGAVVSILEEKHRALHSRAEAASPLMLLCNAASLSQAEPAVASNASSKPHMSTALDSADSYKAPAVVAAQAPAALRDAQGPAAEPHARDAPSGPALAHPAGPLVPGPHTDYRSRAGKKRKSTHSASAPATRNVTVTSKLVVAGGVEDKVGFNLPCRVVDGRVEIDHGVVAKFNISDIHMVHTHAHTILFRLDNRQTYAVKFTWQKEYDAILHALGPAIPLAQPIDESLTVADKLCAMLDDASNADIVNWTADGNGFAVTNTYDFQISLQQQYFPRTKEEFDKFVKHVQEYGFVWDKDTDVFTHPGFAGPGELRAHLKTRGLQRVPTPPQKHAMRAPIRKLHKKPRTERAHFLPEAIPAPAPQAPPERPPPVIISNGSAVRNGSENAHERVFAIMRLPPRWMQPSKPAAQPTNAESDDEVQILS